MDDIKLFGKKKKNENSDANNKNIYILLQIEFGKEK